MASSEKQRQVQQHSLTKTAGLGHEQVESRGATNKVSALDQQKAVSRQKPNQVKSPSLVQDWQSQGRAMTQSKLLFLHTHRSCPQGREHMIRPQITNLEGSSSSSSSQGLKGLSTKRRKNSKNPADSTWGYLGRDHRCVYV